MLPDKRRILISLATFALVFAGLNLPARAFGRAVALGVCALANAFVRQDAPERELDLHFEPFAPNARAAELSVDQAWTAAVRAERRPGRARAYVSLNLRKTLWVPLAVFIALVIASPIWRRGRGFVVLAIGALVLQVPLAVGAATNLAGVLYEQYVIDLSELAQGAVRFSYAVLAPPGMFYAMPLLVWAALIYLTRPKAGRAPIAA